MNFARKTITVDGLITGYLEAGAGQPVVLLHGGEFGASAEIGWERTISALADHYRVIAPDQLGYGATAKVLDFVDGRGMRIRHVAALLAHLGVESAYFVGNSMGAINLFVDTTSEAQVLPVRAMVTICGGGEIQAGEHMTALYDYDATPEAMRRIVTALFADPGAWESIAAARFRRPGSPPQAAASSARRYDRIRVPTLVVEGGADKLLPAGWAAEIAGQITGARSAVVENAGHCPQIEQPDVVNRLLLDFFAEQSESAK